MRKSVSFFVVIPLLFCLHRGYAESVLPLQRLHVWIPQSDDQTANALKMLEKYPALRFVWALSPRFYRGAKDNDTKNKLKELVFQGRIVFALQIPNAPILPLLMNTDEAQGALGPGGVLPAPRYASPDDAIQHLTHAKAEFIKQWGTAPQGVVVPYGAFSGTLGRLLQSQGWDWAVAALGLPGPGIGPSQIDSFLSWKTLVLWDGAQPSAPASSFEVRVWDEREQKGAGGAKILEQWAKALDHDAAQAVLPLDAGLPGAQKVKETAFQHRTWLRGDWTPWIGLPEKNAFWSALRKTREAMTAYQNSGQAQLSRLDAAMEEFLTAENSNYLMTAGSATLSDVYREDRARDFETTLGTVYRFMGQTVPEDLLKTEEAAPRAADAAAPVATAGTLPDGRDHWRLADALLTLDIVASSDTLTWSVGLSSPTANLTVDVYIDINGLPNVGLTTPLPGRILSVRPEDAWEYALSFAGNQATLYRLQGTNGFTAAGTFPAVVNGGASVAALPRTEMRGNWQRWGYRVVALDKDLHVLHVMERKYK